MRTQDTDVVVVGARAAGAATAMLLVTRFEDRPTIRSRGLLAGSSKSRWSIAVSP